MNPLTRLWRGITWFFLSQRECSWCKTVQSKKRLPWGKPIVSHGMCKDCATGFCPQPKRFNLPITRWN